jgi:hypothetical protein
VRTQNPTYNQMFVILGQHFNKCKCAIAYFFDLAVASSHMYMHPLSETQLYIPKLYVKMLYLIVTYGLKAKSTNEKKYPLLGYSMVKTFLQQ